MTPSADLVQNIRQYPKPVALAPLDTLALDRLVSGDADQAIQHARSLAEALTGIDRDGVRLRVLAKALAAERTLQALLEALLAERVRRADVQGVRTLNEALRGCVARLERLAIAHRLDSHSGSRPSVVLINHAENVRVGAA